MTSMAKWVTDLSLVCEIAKANLTENTLICHIGKAQQDGTIQCNVITLCSK